MRTIILQDDEADELERILDAILISGSLSEGSVKRTIKRVSMKLHWSKQKEEAA
jgi:hypothetical protein